jgi:L-lactate dehydrogenase complex protein LldG
MEGGEGREGRLMSREAVMSAIRRSLGVTGRELPRRAAVDERIERAPKGVIPARGHGDAAQRLHVFKDMVLYSQATLAEVGSRAEVPQAVAAFLRDHNLPSRLRSGDDPRLASLAWGNTTIELSTGRSDGSDPSAVSHALAGVAETGTLVLASGADNPTTLNFLPDNHIVVVDARDVVPDYETMWARVRRTFGKGTMPRTLNWITGPSRSADIEQTLLLGAHGPRRLHVIVVNG